MTETKPAEVDAKVAESKSDVKRQGFDSSKHMDVYGSHSCTCDGCETTPIVGFRLKCTKCPDHDVCEECFNKFLAGNLPHKNKLNNLSKDINDHAFKPFADPKKFQGLMQKKTMPAKTKKTKPNDDCHCGSGKKYKKCCFAKDSQAAS